MNRKLPKILFALIATLAFNFSLSAQKVAIKTNLLYGATATPNLQLELGLSKKSTLELGAGMNWFDFSNNKKFNVGGWDIPVGRLDAFKDNRYEGYLYGAGISYGYQWVVHPRWNIEASIGAGFARIHYDKYQCATCGTKQDEGKYNYFGVTKGALSLIYFLK